MQTYLEKLPPGRHASVVQASPKYIPSLIPFGHCLKPVCIRRGHNSIRTAIVQACPSFGRTRSGQSPSFAVRNEVELPVLAQVIRVEVLFGHVQTVWYCFACSSHDSAVAHLDPAGCSSCCPGFLGLTHVGVSA